MANWGYLNNTPQWVEDISPLVLVGTGDDAHFVGVASNRSLVMKGF